MIVHDHKRRGQQDFTIPMPSYTKEHIESLPAIRDREALFEAMKRDEYLVWAYYPEDVTLLANEEGCDEHARYVPD